VGIAGSAFRLLQDKHKQRIFQGEASLPCALTDKSHTPNQSIGYGSIISPDAPDYDASDVLRGIPSNIGVCIDPETGLFIPGATMELAVASDDVPFGKPKKGWIGRVVNYEGDTQDFSVDACMFDQTLGIYRLTLILISAQGVGRDFRRMAP